MGLLRPSGVRFFPQRFKNLVENVRLVRPVDEAPDEFVHEGLPLLLCECLPCLPVYLPGLGDVPLESVPRRRGCLLGSTEGAADAAGLLPKVFHGRNLEGRGTLPGRCVLAADDGPEADTLFLLAAEGRDFNSVRVGWRLLNVDFLRAAGLCGCGVSVLQVRHTAAHAGRVFVRPHVDVGEGRLVDVPAHLCRGHIEELAGFVLGEEPGVPSVDALHLVEFLVPGNDVVITPQQPLSEHREELLIDGLLAPAKARHKDVLRVDVLGCL